MNPVDMVFKSNALCIHYLAILNIVIEEITLLKISFVFLFFFFTSDFYVSEPTESWS